jgi:serine protease Do
MSRWIVPALGVSALLAAGLGIAPSRVRAGGEEGDPDGKRIERRIEIVRPGGARLGVRITEVGKEDVARLKLPDERGALVKSLEADSPAAKAGIKEGDVILRYQGENVLSAAQLRRLVRESPAGRTVAIEVSRGGAVQKLSATLAEGGGARISDGEFDGEVPMPPIPPMAEVPPLPEMPRAPEMPRGFRFEDDGNGRRFFFAEPGRPRRLGIQFQEIQGQLAQYFHLADERGVLVTSVDKDGPAGKAGMKAGDVILKFDGKSVAAGEDLREEVRRAEGGKEVLVTVQRDGKPVDLKVQLPSADAPRRAGGVKL